MGLNENKLPLTEARVAALLRDVFEAHHSDVLHDSPVWNDMAHELAKSTSQPEDAPFGLGRVHVSTEAERQYREAGEPVGPGGWHEGFKRGFTYALSLRDAEQSWAEQYRAEATDLRTTIADALIREDQPGSTFWDAVEAGTENEWLKAADAVIAVLPKQSFGDAVLEVLTLDVVGPIVERAILETQGKPAGTIQACEIVALELQSEYKKRRGTEQAQDDAEGLAQFIAGWCEQHPSYEYNQLADAIVARSKA